MSKRLAVGLFVCLSLLHTAYATVRHVPADHDSIQLAINACDHGDTVIVSPGIYYETINFNGKNIVLTGTDPNSPGIVGYTIIHAEEKGSAVTFANGETSAAVITGFTIVGGTGTLNMELDALVPVYWGAGIYCNRSFPTITKNVLTGNDGPFVIEGDNPANFRLGYGGAIACLFGGPTITHNIVRGNTAYAGAGVMTYLSDALVRDNMIFTNSAMVGGGVVLIGGDLINNTIVGNDIGLSPADGAAGNVYVVFDPGIGISQITNNIIANAPSGSGILWEGALVPGAIAFNNLWNNAPGDYWTIDPETFQPIIDGPASQTGLFGNISQDPLFVAAVAHDYHIRLESPCINAGDPNLVIAPDANDIDNQPRVYAGRIDIGADEYVGYVKPIANAGPDQHVLDIVPVTLDGTASFFYDPCGVMTYAWTQVAGAAVMLDDPNSSTPVFTPSEAGQYVFELVVADDRYAGEPDRVLVLVGTNQPPVADAGPDLVERTGVEVVLDGSASFDPDPPDRLSYHWTQIEGPNVVLHDGHTAHPYIHAARAGEYVFELIVNDGFVDGAPDRVRIVLVEITTGERSVNTGVPNDACCYPDVSGSHVVYAFGQGLDYVWNIVCKDFRTGEEWTFDSRGIDTQPKIDDGRIVWAGGPPFWGGRRPENLSIFLADIFTNRRRTLRTHSQTTSYSHPAISGDVVVWLQHAAADKGQENSWRNSWYDVCGAVISDPNHPQYFTIAERVARRDPYNYLDYSQDFDDVIDIDGYRVVWEADGNIYGADISNLDDIRTFMICPHTAHQYDPAVSGTLVVWTDTRNDAGDIYGADISDPANIREIEIARRSNMQSQPAVDGLMVTYTDGILPGLLRAAYVMKSHHVLNIELSNRSAVDPAIDAQTLVWLDSPHGFIRATSLRFGYAAPNGPVANVTSSKRYDVIQHAINDAQDGDQIIIEPGVYRENIDFHGKNISVVGTDPNDPDTVAATVLTGSGPLATFSGGEDGSCLLAGLTLTDALVGVACYEASPRISRCSMTDHANAGILLRRGGQPVIDHCRITANRAQGIDMRPANTTGRPTYTLADVSNCLIAANRMQGVAGGLPTIRNCTIADNLGIGVECLNASVTNSIVYFNHEQAGQSLQMSAGKATVTYSNVQGGWSGLGNIGANPRFVERAVWVDAAETLVHPLDPNARAVPGDYHLRSEGWSWHVQRGVWTWDDQTSPCIDMGNPGWPLGDEPQNVPEDPDGKWGQNQRINMGAYGGTAQASLAPCGGSLLADVTNDGRVDFSDYVHVAGRPPGTIGPAPGDLNRNGRADLADARLLAQQWLEAIPSWP